MKTHVSLQSLAEYKIFLCRDGVLDFIMLPRDAFERMVENFEDMGVTNLSKSRNFEPTVTKSEDSELLKIFCETESRLETRTLM